MTCNNSVIVLYDVDENGITLPSKYNENNLVGDMLKSLSDIKDSAVIEVPVDVSIIETPSDTIAPTTPSELSTTSTSTTSSPSTSAVTEAVTTTLADATTAATTAANGAVEYFTNKLTCTNKNNYLLFGIVITILLLIIVSVLNKRI